MHPGVHTNHSNSPHFLTMSVYLREALPCGLRSEATNIINESPYTENEVFL